MGNKNVVYAKAEPASSADLPPAPPLPADQKPEDIPVPEPGVGLYEDLHKKTKDLFPQLFDGCRLQIQKGLSRHFQIGHTMTMTAMSAQPPGYKFSATFVGDKQISPAEAYPVMMGEIEPNGNLNAQFIHQLTDHLRTRCVAQIQKSKWVNTQATFDQLGSDYTASATLANLNLQEDSGIFAAQYLQRVTGWLSLGTELMYQRGKTLPGEQMAVLSLAARLQMGCKNMINDILESLEGLGSPECPPDEGSLQALISDSSQLLAYSSLVSWLANEISVIGKLDENLHPISSLDEIDGFLLELSGFMRECKCPHISLNDGPISERLDSPEKRELLLHYLCMHLMALRMATCNNPAALLSAAGGGGPQEKKPQSSETEHGASLRRICQSLGFPKPPETITASQVFSKIESKLKQLLANDGSKISVSLLKARLSDKQWQTVLMINEELCKEYECRRDMMLKRLDATVQSFLWSEIAQKRMQEISQAYRPLRQKMIASSKITVADILAAREDVLQIEKTSGAFLRQFTACSVNKVMIGKVPDRGGRANEHQAPPPEMPAFQQRQQQQQGRGGGGYRGGGGRGDSRRGGGGGRGGGHRGGGGGGWGQPGPQQSANPFSQQNAPQPYQQGNFQYQQGGGGYHQQQQQHLQFDGRQVYHQQQPHQQYHQQQSFGGGYGDAHQTQQYHRGGRGGRRGRGQRY